jgi:hypothetical protein
MGDHQKKLTQRNSRTKKKRGTQLELLGSVVVSGWPPLASRICNRVSLNSRPGSEVVAAGAATATAAATGVGARAVLVAAVAVPSRWAFSSAAFCARSRLSASIFALIAARAFLSFSFSVNGEELS